MSARALDQLAGVARGTTALLESQKRKHITAETARLYIRALGCSLDWLVTGSGKAPTVEQVSSAVVAAKSRRPKTKAA
jgi:hypothetical protein